MSNHPPPPHGDDHGHGGEHGEHAAYEGSPFMQHHYHDAQHQVDAGTPRSWLILSQREVDAGKLVIWLFLAQEVLFFSALFVAYILYRHHHPEIYSYAHKYLDV